jgi:N-acyl homoserine lactone hydrolase
MSEIVGPVARLYILDYGLFQVHANGRVIGIPGFLIQTTGGQNILVDTGFPVRYTEDAAAATLADGLEVFGRVLAMGPENQPAPQLAKLGLRPDDIDLVIMTHSDIDHVGGIADFPAAPMLIGAAERALPAPRYFGSARPMRWPEEVEYQLVTEDMTLCEGVQVLLTPGHAPGQLSLLLTLPETGPVLLTGDAISRPAELDEGFGGAWDETQARQNAERLLALAAERGAFIIYGHDPRQWPSLRKAPAFYG